MTPAEQAFDDGANDEHMTDLLRDTGLVRVTRHRNGLWIQGYESEEALKQYLVSKRRKELIQETESHYPGGGANDFLKSASLAALRSDCEQGAWLASKVRPR